MRKVKKGTLSSRTSRIGVRVSARTSNGTGLFRTLQKRIAQRFNHHSNTAPKQILTTSVVAPSHGNTTLRNDYTVILEASAEHNIRESEDYKREGHNGEVESGDKFKTKQSKIGDRMSIGIDQSVITLLDPLVQHCDVVHRTKKEYVFSALDRISVLFSPSFVLLLARIFEFLDPLEPARVTAYVNKAMCASVKAYYSLNFPRCRLKRYLAHRFLESRESSFPIKALEFLPIADRVRASLTCRSFYHASNALPLEFNNARSVQTFLACYAFPQTSRIYRRFDETPALSFHEANAEDVVSIMQMLEGAGDDNSNHATNCFEAVHSISLNKVSGLSDSNGKHFERLMQTLFMDHVSSRLRILELTELHLEDLQYKHLAGLWRNAQFPNLQRLSLAKNAFSNRFVRDWSWSFEHERFTKLIDIDLSNTEMTSQDLERVIACLSTISALRILNLSYNLCTFTSLQKLRDQIETQALMNLEELYCVAITEDDRAIGHLLEIFQTKPPCCPRLRLLDVSGNPLNTVQPPIQRGRVSVSVLPLSATCLELQTLTISSMRLGDDGFQAIAMALLQGPESKIQNLDISNNAIRSSIDTFSQAMLAGKLPHVRSLAAADNELEALEFEALSFALAANCCPRLQHLDLSANFARGEGIARFCVYLRSPPAQKLWSLDLSNNEISHRGLLQISEELAHGNCEQLHELNLSRNSELQALTSFLDLIRSTALPSLTILQVGYALSRSDGRALVKNTLKQRSIQELRKLKQLCFEKKLRHMELENEVKAERTQVRCHQQAQRLREVYDRIGSEAEEALTRRKQVNQCPRLRIHQEIKHQKHRQARAVRHAT